MMALMSARSGALAPLQPQSKRSLWSRLARLMRLSLLLGRITLLLGKAVARFRESSLHTGKPAHTLTFDSGKHQWLAYNLALACCLACSLQSCASSPQPCLAVLRRQILPEALCNNLNWPKLTSCLELDACMHKCKTLSSWSLASIECRGRDAGRALVTSPIRMLSPIPGPRLPPVIPAPAQQLSAAAEAEVPAKPHRACRRSLPVHWRKLEHGAVPDAKDLDYSASDEESLVGGMLSLCHAVWTGAWT